MWNGLSAFHILRADKITVPGVIDALFDDQDTLVEVLGRLADLSVSHETFKAAVAKYPEKRICIRDRACVIRSGDRRQG
jgi:hypothetical protein